RSSGKVLIEIRKTGLGIEREVFDPGTSIIPFFDELVAWTGGKGGSQFQVLERVLLKVGGCKPEQAFGDKKVHLDCPARVSSSEDVVLITVDVPTVESQAKLFTASHEVSQQAGISEMAVSGCLRVAASKGAFINNRGLDQRIERGDRVHRNRNRFLQRFSPHLDGSVGPLGGRADQH